MILTTPTVVAGVGFSAVFVCLSVFPHDILKTTAARFTKLDIEMFHHESWKYMYFGVERLMVNVARHKSAGVGLCTFFSAGFF